MKETPPKAHPSATKTVHGGIPAGGYDSRIQSSRHNSGAEDNPRSSKAKGMKYNSKGRMKY